MRFEDTVPVSSKFPETLTLSAKFAKPVESIVRRVVSTLSDEPAVPAAAVWNRSDPPAPVPVPLPPARVTSAPATFAPDPPVPLMI